VRVLAFRHEPMVDLGHIRPAIEDRGLGLEVMDSYREGAAMPDTSDAAGLIFLGGTMSVNDELPYLRQEIQLIAQAIERGQPVLGVCLGAQMMARALGCKVYRNAVPEIGWAEIYFTESASEDPVFSDFGSSQMMFHWHGETFDLPAVATRLAYSRLCRNQAFRIGRASYGLQFHAEVTPEMIAEWSAQDSCVEVLGLPEPIDTELHAETLSLFAARLFGSWADLLV